MIEDFDGLWKKAVSFAQRRGLGDESEDFASDFIRRKLEGKCQKASIEQAFFDYSKSLRADKRVLGSPEGYFSKGIVTSLDKPIRDAGDDGATIRDFIGTPGDDMELRSELGDTAKLIDGVIGLVKNNESREHIRSIYYQYIKELF